MKRKALLFPAILALLVACTGPPEKMPEVDYQALYLPELEGFFQTYQKLLDRGAYEALGDTLQRANRDLQASELYVEAARAYWMAGMEEATAAMLHRAIDQGMSNPNILEKIGGGKPLPEGPRWGSLQKRLDSIRSELKQVSNFEMKAGSMERFWPFFEAAMADTSQARKHLRAFILSGPPEIRDFYVVRYGNVGNLYGQMVNAAPGYYQYLKEQFKPDSLRPLQEATTRWMERFRELYPEAVFPKVFLVPGILNSGGTATEMGMFLGADMYGRSPQMPTEQLSEWQEESIMTFRDLPKITIHELMHFQQNYRDTLREGTLLAAVLQEGVCDFMVELCSGEPLESDNLEFLADQGNREWIFGELQRELYGEDTSKWLYNGDIEDRPNDLGYAVGYLISKSFYQRHPDKKRAVEELLTTDDYTRILRGSRYAFLLERDTTDFGDADL
jgi:hypothetical protein